MPPSIDPLIQCTVATQDLSACPGGKQFLAAYEAKYGPTPPDPYAIYGYEAMKLGLNTIASLGANGDNKSDVLKVLFATTSRSSVLGTYGFNKNGDTTLKSYGLYKVGSNGPEGSPSSKGRRPGVPASRPGAGPGVFTGANLAPELRR